MSYELRNLLSLSAPLGVLALALCVVGCDESADLGYTTRGYNAYQCEGRDEAPEFLRDEYTLDRERRCDGIVDCPQGDDEQGCDGDEPDMSADTDMSGPLSCVPDEFACANASRCIPRSWLCDDDNDCGDFSDEEEASCGSATDSYEGDESSECSDDVDNDGDGVQDCDDAGCSEASACVTPSGVEGTSYDNCDDGFDNDSDGYPDCADGACSDAVVCTTSPCADVVMDSSTTAYAFESVVGRPSTYEGACGVEGGSDLALSWTAPESGCYLVSFVAPTFDPLLRGYFQCGGQEFTCIEGTVEEPPAMWVNVTAGSRVLIVVDSQGDGGGSFGLTIEPWDGCGGS